MNNEYTEFFDKFQQPKPKYNSPDEIRIALGLEPWDEFAIESIQLWLADKHTDNAQKLEYIYSKRRTGQTTKMLVEAVYVSQFEPVGLSGFREVYTIELVKRAKEICRQLGLDDLNIKPWTQKMQKDSVSYSKTLVDHYRGNKS